MNIIKKSTYTLELSSTEFHSILDALRVAKQHYHKGTISNKESERLYEELKKEWELK